MSTPNMGIYLRKDFINSTSMAQHEQNKEKKPLPPTPSAR